MMNVEKLRDYCLSLGADVEERMPFAKFHGADKVLVFYVCGHMFCYFDIERLEVITLKCQPERIAELQEAHEWIGKPYNASPKYWIGIRTTNADTALTKELIKNSYEIVKGKYRKEKAKKRPAMMPSPLEPLPPHCPYCFSGNTLMDEYGNCHCLDCNSFWNAHDYD